MMTGFDLSDRPSAFYEVPTAAYLHIPFCRRRCYYCDFPVVVVGDRPPLARQGQRSYGAIAQYLPVLQQEIAATPILGGPLDTVFFGGGTPSLLSAEQLASLMQHLAQRFGIQTDAECSIEMDPDTLEAAQLAGYVAAGVNRISLGVQAFQPELLAACGRTHTPADIDRAVDQIHAAGLQNLSLDLISGLPRQTLATWQASLERAIALNPTHISVYDLIVEPMTAFAQWYRPGEAPLPSDALTAEMYRLTVALLTDAGFEHYEISNYARPGFACRHNRQYWENRPYYGFGLGAASYTQGQRFTRPRTRQAYFDWVAEFQQHRGAIASQRVTLTDRLLDTVMLGLRLAEGLDLLRFAQQFGETAQQQLLGAIAPLGECGWVQVSPSQRLRLTDPEGFLFSNVVLSQIFEAFMTLEA
jgi:putative oxygen-independent coproporphyrinogen III oxidase